MFVSSENINTFDKIAFFQFQSFKNVTNDPLICQFSVPQCEMTNYISVFYLFSEMLLNIVFLFFSESLKTPFLQKYFLQQEHIHVTEFKISAVLTAVMLLKKHGLTCDTKLVTLNNQAKMQINQNINSEIWIHFCFSLCCGEEAQCCSRQMEIMSSAVHAERDVLKHSLSPDFHMAHLSHNLKSKTHMKAPSAKTAISESASYCSAISWWFFFLPHLWKCIWQICISDF